MITCLAVGQLQTNCYIVSDEDSKTCMIIDPGDDAEYIISRIDSLALEPKVIIATHGHFDHILGAALITTYYSLPLYISTLDEKIVQSAQSSVKKYIGKNYEIVLPPVMCDCMNINPIQLGQSVYTIIPSPGHTPGSIVIIPKDKSCCFVGDILGKDGEIGRTDHTYSNRDQMRSSINRLLHLADDTIVYPGHGYDTTIGQEIHYLRAYCL